MPFYEYSAKNTNQSCEYCSDKFELMQSINDPCLKSCPKCGADVVKLVSLVGAFVFKGRQMNQYNIVKNSKYWTDQNGVRHKVTPADGSTHSPTVPSRVTASPEQISARKSRNDYISKNKFKRKWRKK